MSKQQLSAFVDGALSGVSRELVTRHLDACASCREKHAAWKAADESLRQALAWKPNDRTLEEWSSRVEMCLTAERKGLPVPEFTPTLLPVIAPASPSALVRMRELLEEARARRVVTKSEELVRPEVPREEVAPSGEASAEAAPEKEPAASVENAAIEPVVEPVAEEVAAAEAAPEPVQAAEPEIAQPVVEEVPVAEVAAPHEEAAPEPEHVAEQEIVEPELAEPELAQPVVEEVPVAEVVAPHEEAAPESEHVAEQEIAAPEIAEPEIAQALVEEPPVAEAPAPEEQSVPEPETVAALELAPLVVEEAPVAEAPEPEEEATPQPEPVAELELAPLIVEETPVAEVAATQEEAAPQREPVAEAPAEQEPEPEPQPEPIAQAPPALALEAPIEAVAKPVRLAEARPALALESMIQTAVVRPKELEPAPVAEAQPVQSWQLEAEPLPMPPAVVHEAPSSLEPPPPRAPRPAMESVIESRVPTEPLATARDLSTFAGSREPQQKPVRVSRVAEPSPRLSSVPKPAARPAPKPRDEKGQRQLLAALTVLLVVVLASVFMPDVIRIPLPESWQPRMPRVEFVRRHARTEERPTRDPGTAIRTALSQPVVPELVPSQPKPVRDDSAIAKAPARPADAVTPAEEVRATDAQAASSDTASGTAVASATPRPRTQPRSAKTTATKPAPSRGSAPPTKSVRVEQAPTYVPDQPATIIPTKVTTTVQLSSPPAPKPAAPKPAEPERDEQWPLLCGEVRDQNDQPVAGALVELVGPSLSVRTDRRGRFCVACPPGARSLRVQAEGFRLVERTVDLASGMVETQISLEPAR